MKTTIDTFTGKKFRWNTTCVFHAIDGTATTVPARCTARVFTTLHPDRVPAALLAELNGSAQGVQSGGVGVQSDVPLYRQEFPDFDYDLPAIPGMIDSSWHNDVCPSLVGNGFQLWCDYLDPAQRESFEGTRFALYRDNDGEIGDFIVASDSLDDIMAALATARATA